MSNFNYTPSKTVVPSAPPFQQVPESHVPLTQCEPPRYGAGNDILEKCEGQWRFGGNLTLEDCLEGAKAVDRVNGRQWNCLKAFCYKNHLETFSSKEPEFGQ